jgi:hypothetical protein
MAATLSAGVNSLILKLDTPYDTIRLTDIRDDLIKVKVWCSATSNFTPVDTLNALGVANVNPNQVFDGLSLSIVIPKLADGIALASGTPYYVKYAFISDIEEEVFTVSSQLTATPTAATSQIVDISGFTSFVKSDETTFTPTNATLTAVIAGITNPVYAWTITGATPTTGTGSSITITPNSTNGTGVGVTLSVTGTGLTTPIVKTITIPITYVPPTYYISNYGAAFRRDLDGVVYPAAGIVLDSGYSKFRSTPQPTFVWKKDNVVIPGATSYSYTVPASDYADSTSHVYTSIATGFDLGGNLSSITASVQIPRIDDGPIGPATPSFTISNYGAVFRKDNTNTLYPTTGIILQTTTLGFKSTPAVTYQWKKNDTNISGATSNSYTVPVGDYATVSTNNYSCTATGQTTAGVATVITATVTLPVITDGSLGSTGPRTASGYIYYNTAQADAPLKPSTTSVDYTYGTGVFTGLDPAWSTAVNTATPVAGTKVWACSFTVLEPSYQSVTPKSIVFSEPFTFQNFTGLVTFSNMNDAFGTNVTTINGNKITTGTIAAQYLDLSGTLKVSSINPDGSVNTTTQINGGSIKTGTIDADRLNAQFIKVGTTNGDGSVNTTTQINGGSIQTGSISADKLTTQFLQVGNAASDINSGTTTINGGKIETNSIETSSIKTGFLRVGDAAGDINGNSTTVNGGKITTGSIDALRLSIGNTTGADRIRLYDNKIEIWANNVRRVVLGDLS